MKGRKAASTQRDAARSNRGVELLGDALNALGRGVEQRGRRRLAGLVAVGARNLRFLDGHELVLQAPQPAGHLAKLIGDRERRHDGEPRIADLAELRTQHFDPSIELAGKLCEMLFLAVLARHAELATVDGDVDLRHSYSRSIRWPGLLRDDVFCSLGSLIRLCVSQLFLREHAADGFNRLIDPTRHFPSRSLQTARARGRVIKLACQSRAVGTESMDLGDEGILPAVDFVAPLGSRLKRIQRMRQPLACKLDGITIAHLAILGRHKRRARHTLKPCDRKYLHTEAYVASSFSVNVQSDFRAALCMTQTALPPCN